MSRGVLGQILCPVVVGRDRELAALRELLQSARDGGGAVLCLVGEPGIGKTRLTREARAAAETTGMTALRGRSVPSATPIPYLALGEALIPALQRPEIAGDETIAALRPALRPVLHERTGGRAAEPSMPIVHDAVVRVLGAIARRSGGLLLILEDIHWADADTLGVLEHLSDHIATEPVLVLLTLRDDPGPASDLAESLAARRTAHRFLLARLSAEETTEMARIALDVGRLDADLAAALDERTEGVPFVVEEMLTAYSASDAGAGLSTVLPHTYTELVRTRLAAVDEPTRHILFAAAVVGRRFDWNLLSAITGLDRAGVFAALQVAVREKLVSSDPAPGLEMPFSFRHALVRDALLAELLPPELRDLSDRAADAIERLHQGLPGEWCERVADLRELAGDLTRSAARLQEAAQRAFVRGALGSAEAMLERARPMVGDDRWHRIGIDRQLVEVLAIEGKVDRLREIASDALAFVLEKRTILPFLSFGLGYLHLRLARGMASAGETEGADENLRLAVEHARANGDDKLLARVRAFEAVRALEHGDLAFALSAARELSDEAQRLGARDIRAEALSVEGRAAFLSGDGERALRTLGVARDEAGDDVVARIAALIDLGRVEAAIMGDLADLESARVLAATAGAVSSQARAELSIAETHVDRFALAEAEALLDRTVASVRELGLALLPQAAAIEAERRALGPDEEAARSATDALTGPTRAQLVLAIRLEDREAARLAASRLVDDAVAHAANALLSAIEGDDVAPEPTAHRLAAGLLQAASIVRSSDVPTNAILAGVRETLAPFPWWHHVALRLIAQKAAEAGWGDRVLAARECLTFFEDGGFERLAGASRAILRSAGAPVPRKGRGDSTVPGELRKRGVTSREMDVLRLVGRGHGNVEIATRLFLSRRTVETHVASLMRKLQVETRSELAAAANSVGAGA